MFFMYVFFQLWSLKKHFRIIVGNLIYDIYIYMINIFIFNICYQIVLHFHGHNMFCLLSDWYHNCARFLSTNSWFLGRWFTIFSLKDWSFCPDMWLCTLVWREWRSDLMSFVSPCILLDPWSQCFYRVYISILCLKLAPVNGKWM